MKFLIPFLFLLWLPGCENQSADSQDSARTAVVKSPGYVDANPVQGRVNQRGLYKLVRSSGVVDDPNTSTGKAVIKPVIQLVKSKDRIPLVKGAQMYLQYRIWYLPDQPAYIDLRRVLKHPAMTLPDGKVTTGSDFMFKTRVSVNQAIGYTGYGFDEDYELVEGDWVFEIWYKDRKMIEQTFTTYRPDKDEIAVLESVLAQNYSVGIQGQTPEKPYSKLNWPRIVVKEKTTTPDQKPSSDELSNPP